MIDGKDKVGNALFAPPAKTFKDVYDIANMNGKEVMTTYHDRLTYNLN